MKAKYNTANGRLSFEIEGETVKALFSHVSSIQEVFDAEKVCGMCNSEDIRYLARKVDDFDFYELACQKCRARFAFGQAKKGGALFPKRRDDDGNPLPHGGWSRYENQSTAPAVPPQGKPVSFPQSVATPDGLQPSFDRIGDLFGKPSPTRIGPALDMIREQMHHVAGKAGTDQFDAIYRRFESGSSGRSDVSTIKTLLRDLMQSHDKLKQEVHA